MYLLEPDQIRDQAHEVLSRPEFQRSKSPLAKAWEWIVDHLPHFGGGGGTFAGVGQVLQWLLLILLVAGVALLIWWVARNWVGGGRRKDREEAVHSELDTRRTVTQWRKAAERYEAAGDWKEALRCRYAELVGRLVQRDLAPATLGRTTGELRIDVGSSLPTVGDEFSEATLLFELAWYGARPTGPDENRRFRELAELVAAAQPPTTDVALEASTTSSGESIGVTS